MRKRSWVICFMLITLLVPLFANGNDEKQSVVDPVTLNTPVAVPTAKPKAEYLLRFSWSDPADPLRQSTSAYANVFKNDLERLSAGRIKVELYPAAQLGDQNSSTEQVAKGTIEACNISSGVLASLYFPKLGILDAPYIFKTREEGRRFLDVKNSPFMIKLAEECRKATGIRLLDVTPFGFRNMTNNKRPIHSPADMKGMKIRTMQIVPHMKMIEAFGASATPIPFAELYTSLQTNVIDGEENTIQNIVAQKFYEVQKYVTVTQHVLGIGATLINDAWYQALPDDLKIAVYEADRNAVLAYNGVGQILDVVGMQTLKTKNVNIYVPNEQEREAFVQASVPAVRAWMEQKYGKDFVSNFYNAVDKTDRQLQAEALM
ncbi:TRAP transporter substrate-binding protein [Clostridium sp.]|uniref:TRAP transporter substrate-binding protein n=1 Tax=Clostridium sp. TaxID=1506 RepID=UPI001A37CCF4|nr:TRAP transporter substrate-binding protein [Clostridium sp.]MBK5242946.1 TRAP transporter substrate-binding protein [Clostridium sp.]